MITDVTVLGAEAQAATSLALAYPDRHFIFVSDCPVIDGWDLPNVTIQYGQPRTYQVAVRGSICIPLSTRWIADSAAMRLSRLFPRIERFLPGLALPILSLPPKHGRVFAKGDAWHRPDAPMAGTADELADLQDTHGCGLVYQELLPSRGTVMSIGYRSASGAIAFGLFRIHAERFFRIDLIQAAESVAEPVIAARTQAVLDALQWQSWFSMNWLLGEAGPRLSSLRPTPKAIFGCFRRDGIDLLAPLVASTVLRPQHRFVAQPHYAEFQWLRP